MAPPTSLWARQNLGDDVSSAKQTFSSWDGCMAKDYCKYPVIIVIIVVSLIVLSVLLCIVRCCCCGMECCCSMCSCFNACCPSPRNRRDRPSKFADQPGDFNNKPGPFNSNTGYQSQAPLAYSTPAQYAQFDTGRKNKGAGPGGLHEDALPAMPSWDNATSHRIPDDSHHEESHEMNAMPSHDDQRAPMLAHQAPSPGVPGGQYAAGAAYHDQTGSNPDAFRSSAIAPSPYAHASHDDHYHDEYAQQDQQNPLARYGQSASPAPIPTASPLAHAQTYSSSPNPYGQHNHYEQGYGHDASYGVAEVPGSHVPQGYSTSMQQGYEHHSASPNGASNLPNALQSGASPAPPAHGGYQAYGGAYNQAKPANSYAAYNPAASEAASTQYEPQSYHGSAAGYDHHGYHDV